MERIFVKFTQDLRSEIAFVKRDLSSRVDDLDERLSHSSDYPNQKTTEILDQIQQTQAGLREVRRRLPPDRSVDLPGQLAR